MKRKILFLGLLTLSLISVSACSEKKNNIELFDEALHEAYPTGLDYKPNWYSIRLEENSFGPDKIYKRSLEGVIYADFKDNFYGTFIEAEYIDTYTIIVRNEEKVISNTKYENEFKCKHSNLYLKKTMTNMLTNEAKVDTFGSAKVQNRIIEELFPSSFFDYSSYLSYNTLDNNEDYAYVDDNLKSYHTINQIHLENANIGMKKCNLIFDLDFVPIVMRVIENRDYYGLASNNEIEYKNLELNILRNGENIEVPIDYSLEYELKENGTILLKF